MSYQAKTERSKRLEKWAGLAALGILQSDKTATVRVVIDAWDIAVRMEDRRSEVMKALLPIEPISPSEWAADV